MIITRQNVSSTHVAFNCGSSYLLNEAGIVNKSKMCFIGEGYFLLQWLLSPPHVHVCSIKESILLFTPFSYLLGDVWKSVSFCPLIISVFKLSLRGLDGLRHFKTILISLTRRALYKNIRKCFNLTLKYKNTFLINNSL